MIPVDYLRRIRRIEIRTRRTAEEFLAGAYRSIFRGRGIDFEDVRGYAAGDDVRFIDWNVTARMNAPYVKQFKEERELSVLIVVDVSASGELASQHQTKRDLAAEVAACLAFSAVSNGDKVGLVLFSDRVEKYLPPRKGRWQVLRVIRDVLYHKPVGRGTSLKRALNYLNHVQTRRAIVFLLSDFLDDGYQRTLKVTSRRHDLVPVVVRDAREQSLPDAGWIVVADAETGEVEELNTGDTLVREAFARLARQRSTEIKQSFRGAGIETIELETGQSFLRPIQRFMEMRMRRRQP